MDVIIRRAKVFIELHSEYDVKNRNEYKNVINLDPNSIINTNTASTCKLFKTYIQTIKNAIKQTIYENTGRMSEGDDENENEICSEANELLDELHKICRRRGGGGKSKKRKSKRRKSKRRKSKRRWYVNKK